MTSPFLDLGLSTGPRRRPHRPRLRGAHAHPARGHPAAARGPDLLGQAGTGTGKTAAFALPMLELLSRKGAKSLAASRRSCSCRRASWPCRSPRPCTSTAAASALAVAAALRRRSRWTQQIRALRRGVSTRRRHAGPRARSPPPRTLDLARAADRRARRSRRDARHGLCRGHRGHPRRNAPEERQTALFCGDDAAAHREPSPSAHLTRPGARARSPSEKRAAGKLPRVRQVAYLVPRAAQDRRARARARRRGAHVGHRVLPHAHRGRRAHRDARGPRLRRRGAARRHGRRSSAIA